MSVRGDRPEVAEPRSKRRDRPKAEMRLTYVPLHSANVQGFQSVLGQISVRATSGRSGLVGLCGGLIGFSSEEARTTLGHWVERTTLILGQVV
jgi:hypothetical protein